jgi:hypothetical protein
MPAQGHVIHFDCHGLWVAIITHKKARDEICFIRQT